MLEYYQIDADPFPQRSADHLPNPDRAALAGTGYLGRTSLMQFPEVCKIETDLAEFFAVSDFLKGYECDTLMAMIDETAQPSTLFPGAEEKYRTSYSGMFGRDNDFLNAIQSRIDKYLGLESSWGEIAQGQRYAPGQEYKRHCDWFWADAAHWDSQTSSGGQRSWTAMIYLNDVQEGGETEFPALGISIPPQQGVLLMWNNAKPDGSPNENTTHAATPVVKGMKYVITKWYRTRTWG